MAEQPPSSFIAPYADTDVEPVNRAGTVIAYIVVIIGYLYAMISSTRLSIPTFLIFTALNIFYCAILWWLTSEYEFRQWQIILVAILFALIALAAGFCALSGIGWDWLIFAVTVALYFWLFSLRAAIFTSFLIYIAVGFNLFFLDKRNFFALYQSLLQILAAFGFVAIFSLIVRRQREQQERMEKLLSQLETSNAALAEAHEQLQAYANQVEELTIVRERTRVAREIHDTLGHYLSILNIQLETIGRLQERDPARTTIEIAEARRVASQSMQEVRNAVAALRPSSIADLNLTEALTQLGREFERAAPETTLTLDLETELPPLAPDLQVALYRAAQEALTNVRKHARATKVLLRLRYENETLELVILDNGDPESAAGHDLQKQRGGFGLIGLRERVELLGGDIAYGPAQSAGFRVMVCIPLKTLN